MFEANRVESRSIDLGLNENLLQSSLAETTKRKVTSKEDEKTPGGEDAKARKLRKAYASLQQSCSKQSLEGGRDVALKEILDVPDQFSLQSPLPPLCEFDDNAAVQNTVEPFGK